MSDYSCAYIGLPILLFTGFIFYILVLIIEKIALKIKLRAWKNASPNVVIFHASSPCKIAPSSSPFILKLYTYLRMAKIPHQVDCSLLNSFGPKGKAPWISLNGFHMGDTELIIQHLNKTFKRNLNENLSCQEIAIGTAVRVMLEEHAFWGMATERFVHGGKNLSKITSKGAIIDFIFRIIGKQFIKKQAYNQGLGRHSKSEIFELISKDLRTVSTILGDRNFILGELPCQEDCAVFGHLSQFVWGLPSSNYEKLINSELPNLRRYCERMRDLFFEEDWNELLEK